MYGVGGNWLMTSEVSMHSSLPYFTGPWCFTAEGSYQEDVHLMMTHQLRKKKSEPWSLNMSFPMLTQAGKHTFSTWGFGRHSIAKL